MYLGEKQVKMKSRWTENRKDQYDFIDLLFTYQCYSCKCLDHSGVYLWRVIRIMGNFIGIIILIVSS